MSGQTLVEQIHAFAAKAGDTDRILAQGTVTALNAAAEAKQAADTNVSDVSLNDHTLTVTNGSGQNAQVKQITIPDSDTVYTHPTSAGNKHIPAGGSAGKVLKWKADGEAQWSDDNDSVTGVKGNAESDYRTGNVNITAANIGAAATSHSHSASDITDGTLAIARGGTGRTDGYVNDIYLSGSGNSVVTAKGVGQLGEAVTKDAVNANILTTPGLYFCTNTSPLLNYPITAYCYVKVIKHDANIQQILHVAGNERIFKRKSVDSGTTWSNWAIISVSNTGNSLAIYISTSGDDNNTGFLNTAPVKTVARALEIASTIDNVSNLYLCFGPNPDGWGDIRIYGNKINAAFIWVTDFNNTDGASALSDATQIPSFDKIIFYNVIGYVGHIKANLVQAVAQAYVFANRYTKISAIFCQTYSIFTVSGKVEFIEHADYNGGYVVITDYGYVCLTGEFIFPATPDKSSVIYSYGVDGSFEASSASKFTVTGGGTYSIKKFITGGHLNLILNNKTINNIPGTGYSGSFKNNTIFVTSASAVAMSQVTDTYISMISGVSYAHGGSIYLYGKDYATPSAAGTAKLQASNGTDTVALVCNPNGTLSWNGQTVQTSSDARIKTTLENVPDAVLDAWEKVQWGQFKFLADVDRKGDSARLHPGLIAQHVKSVFETDNLDACKYGILCHEVWEDEYEDVEVIDADAVYNEDGMLVTPERKHTEKRLVRAAGDLWMIRYEEANAMEAACQRRKNARLEARIAALEAKLG